MPWVKWIISIRYSYMNSLIILKFISKFESKHVKFLISSPSHNIKKDFFKMRVVFKHSVIRFSSKQKRNWWNQLEGWNPWTERAVEVIVDTLWQRILHSDRYGCSYSRFQFNAPLGNFLLIIVIKPGSYLYKHRVHDWFPLSALSVQSICLSPIQCDYQDKLDTHKMITRWNNIPTFFHYLRVSPDLRTLCSKKMFELKSYL